jgi:hypothetical protein
MPRQIIDTESSRPAYVRRRVSTLVAVLIAAAALAAGAWLLWGHHLLKPIGS